MVGSVNGTSIPTAELRSTRKPLLLFRLSCVCLLRFAERQLSELLFQLPPRFTRFEPVTTHRQAFQHMPAEFPTLHAAGCSECSESLGSLLKLRCGQLSPLQILVESNQSFSVSATAPAIKLQMSGKDPAPQKRQP